MYILGKAVRFYEKFDTKKIKFIKRKNVGS